MKASAASKQNDYSFLTISINSFSQLTNVSEHNCKNMFSKSVKVI